VYQARLTESESSNLFIENTETAVAVEEKCEIYENSFLHSLIYSEVNSYIFSEDLHNVIFFLFHTTSRLINHIPYAFVRTHSLMENFRSV